MLNKLTCESLIFFLAGTAPIDNLPWPKIERSDYNLINILIRQLAKGVGFTDRQYALAKQKIDHYASAFADVDIESAKNELSIPLREIDRSRWIKIVDAPKNSREIDKEKSPYIAVRFTFQKKLIDSLESMKRGVSNEDWSYDKIEKIHYVRYSERNLYKIVNVFKEKNFDISDQVKEIYEKLEQFKIEDYVPGVYDFKIKNLPENGIKMLEQEVGVPTKDNLYLYRDRSLRYGLEYFDSDTLLKSFENLNDTAKVIANRTSRSISLQRDTVQIDDIILSLENLNRLPLLIVLPGAEAHDVLVTMQQSIRNIIAAEDIAVMFRMDNSSESGEHFNEYLKKEKINNKLANNTKIVYTLDNKVPKPLLQSGIEIMSLLVYSSSSSVYAVRKVLETYTNKDLIIHYVTKETKSTRFFYDRQVQEL